MDEPTCRGVIDGLADYFEDALAPRRRDGVESHLARCDRCLTYTAQYQTALAAIWRAA